MHTCSLTSPQAFFSQAFLSGIAALTLLAAVPASAQTLILGQYTGASPGPSGTAAISGLGTTVSDTYKFTGLADLTTTTYKGVTLNHASSLTLQDGGAITGTLFNYNTGMAKIDGGSVKNVLAYDTSVTSVYGGSVFYLTALGSSIGGLSGGATIDLYGGNLTYLAAENGGSINIFGTDLTETFVASSSPFQVYDVTGTLQDGTALDVKYSSSGGTLLFNGQTAVPTLPAVPEASTIVSLGLLLALGLSGMTVARRKKLVAVKP